MALTGDGHVHTEFSWDVGLGDPAGEAAGRMAAMCARAERIGLPAIAFTEHLDVTDWVIEPEDLPKRLRPLVHDGRLAPPVLDADGYLEAVDRCRHRHPDLTILTGVEWGQPHLARDAAYAAIDVDSLDRVNGSLHLIPVDDGPGADRAEPYTLYRTQPAADVLRRNLAEVPAMLAAEDFTVFCHLEYAIRYWPAEREGPFDPRRFEDELRAAMRAIAGADRVLELNVGGPLRPWIPWWWRQEGGRAVTISSDAHEPAWLARNHPEAMAMAEQAGFRPGRRPQDPWTR